jgi:hypothetical protein
MKNGNVDASRGVSSFNGDMWKAVEPSLALLS